MAKQSRTGTPPALLPAGGRRFRRLLGADLGVAVDVGWRQRKQVLERRYEPAQRVVLRRGRGFVAGLAEELRHDLDPDRIFVGWIAVGVGLRHLVAVQRRQPRLIGDAPLVQNRLDVLQLGGRAGFELVAPAPDPADTPALLRHAGGLIDRAVLVDQEVRALAALAVVAER